ncbi:MAG: hypothetical protein E6R13_02850 [Spirochaetes bacterium]|nr:MAG: hypothetical protein E6R13_02850 [Spirochaetota bacterium]
MIEIKKFRTLFDSNDNPYIVDEQGDIVATSEQIGFVYNEGPIHDHNRYWGDSRYLEDLYYPRFVDDMNELGGQVYLVVHEICPNYNGSHIGKDCSCKTGFKVIPKLHQGMVIMDLYGLLQKEHGVYIHE